MKKIYVTLFIGFMTCSAMGQHVRYDTIRYAREYYVKRMAQFQKEPVQKGRTIFLGNSITEYGDWKKLLNDSTVINRGIAADNTFGILDRLNDVTIRQPNKLFLKVGINDLSQNIPVEIIAKNIITIAERVQQSNPQTRIYIHSILPTNDNVKKEYPDAYNKNHLADAVNRELKKVSKSRGFTFVDLSKLLKDKSGKLDTRYAEPDGLHLNAAGYQVWIKLLKGKGYL
jgi:lysophospholipase L1-like esterase